MKKLQQVKDWVDAVDRAAIACAHQASGATFMDAEAPAICILEYREGCGTNEYWVGPASLVRAMASQHAWRIYGALVAIHVTEIGLTLRTVRRDEWETPRP